MAGAHVTKFYIHDLFSFHEEVCEKGEKDQNTEILVKEDCARMCGRRGPASGPQTMTDYRL